MPEINHPHLKTWWWNSLTFRQWDWLTNIHLCVRPSSVGCDASWLLKPASPRRPVLGLHDKRNSFPSTSTVAQCVHCALCAVYCCVLWSPVVHCGGNSEVYSLQFEVHWPGAVFGGVFPSLFQTHWVMGEEGGRGRRRVGKKRTLGWNGNLNERKRGEEIVYWYKQVKEIKSFGKCKGFAEQ